MPKIEVYCTVSNCDYWGKDNHCFAQEILITNDAAGEAWPDSVDTPQAKSLASTPAETCMATCCKTFRPKESHAGPVQELLPHQAYMKNPVRQAGAQPWQPGQSPPPT